MWTDEEDEQLRARGAETRARARAWRRNGRVVRAAGLRNADGAGQGKYG